MDETCIYEPVLSQLYNANLSQCSNGTNPYCESDYDCMGLYDASPFSAACLPFQTTAEKFNIQTNDTELVNVTVPYCLPLDQCAVDADCLLGSTCEPRLLGNETGYSFNVCTGTADFSIPCMNDTDCGLEGLACWNSTACVVTCNTTADCNFTGFACGTPPGVDYMACAPAEAFMTTTLPPGSCNVNSDCLDPMYGICVDYGFGAGGFCVQCENNTNCEMLNGPGSVCEWGLCVNATTSGPTTTEFTCDSNLDCSYPTPYCLYPPYGRCVECRNNDTDCDDGYSCEYTFNGRDSDYRCEPLPTTTTQRTTPTPTTPAPTEYFGTLPPSYSVDSNVGCGEMVSGVTSIVDLVDYYRFSVIETTEATVSTCPPVDVTLGDTRLYIYNEANGSLVDDNDDGGSCSVSYMSEISRIFSPGDYIIAITGYDTETYGSYYVSITCGIETTQEPVTTTEQPIFPIITTESLTSTQASQCTSNDDCLFFFCDTDLGECVYCRDNTDCENAFYGGPGYICDSLGGVTNYCFPPCETTSDCDTSTNSSFPVCNEADGICVQCESNADCDTAAGFECMVNVCSNETLGTTREPRETSFMECYSDYDCMSMYGSSAHSAHIPSVADVI